MFLRFFKSDQLYVLLLLPIIIILFWFFLFNPESHQLVAYSGRGRMALFNIIEALLSELLYLKITLSIILVFGNSLLILYLSSKYSFFNNKTFLQTIIFVLLIAGFNEIKSFSPVLFSVPLIIMAFSEVYKTYKVDNIYSNYFNSGFLIALSSLFYFYSVFFILPILITIQVMRPFNFREFFSTIIGLITPYLIFFSLFFVLSDIKYPINDIINCFDKSDIPIEIHKPKVVLLSFFGFLIMISTFFLFGNYGSKKISTRQYFTSQFWIIISSIVLFFSFGISLIELLYFLAIPFSIIISNYFVNTKSRWISEFIFACFVILVIISFLR